MIVTPLWEVNGNVHLPRFKKNKSYVYATLTDFNIIKGERYLIVGTEGIDIEIVNEIGEREVYTTDYFSMTKPE
ncbi:hypothetical protein M3_0116 [Lysinibacillus phage vB_LfM_LysYB1]|nr:hypothetical protein M3_0116 [Lysinibacillus phage vB_LfM_LysYB1]WAB25374.1 hypothetical protein M5_0196 [Lysinibacillus phage vB_LfM_LysYB2]